MKKYLFVLVLIPLIAFAQKSDINKTSLPLIESICTDTIKGKYQETVFA